MTGATVAWFRGRKSVPSTDTHVKLVKPDNRLEAQQAVRESAERASREVNKRGRVERLVSSLAEIRRENHLSEKIRAAMGGD